MNIHTKKNSKKQNNKRRLKQKHSKATNLHEDQTVNALSKQSHQSPDYLLTLS